MVDIGSGPHNHLESRNNLAAGRTVSGAAEEPAENETGVFD